MKRSLKLLFLDTEPSWRGGQEQLWGLIRGLQQRGHRVVLAADPRAVLAERASGAGIEVLSFRQRQELSPAAFRSLLMALRNESFDVVHSNTPRTIAAAGLAGACCRRHPVRVAARRVIFPLRGRSSALKYNHLVDCIITVCDYVGKVLIRGGVREAQIRTVYEGVDLSALDAVEPSRDPPDFPGPTLGALGALTSEKGHDTLLAAWAQVCRDFPGSRLTLIGDGPCRPALEEQSHRSGLDGRVLFMGFRSDSLALLKRLDLFSLPSRSEGLSSALLEAMGCSLPVVATSVGGTPELVVDGRTGLLVPAGDPQRLAMAIRRALADPSAARAMGDRGRLRIEEKFTLERKVSETENVYAELLASRNIG